MTRTEFRFFDRLRVRWAEVDMQKIVFNGHYLMYFDTAVAAYWRAMALPYHETMEGLGGDLYVRKAVVEYLGSARYDEVCDVGLRCNRIGTSSVQFIAALFRGETLLVHGELVYVWADPATQTSRPVPTMLRDVLLGFERGEPMVDVSVVPWTAARDEARALRHEVFRVEQRLDAPLEEDAADAAAVHVIARNRCGLVVGTGRLVDAGACVGRVGRMAVHAAVRSSGVGRALVARLIAEARALGHRELVLDAALMAAPLYRRAGFVDEGPPFEELGLTHQTMRLAT